MKICPMCNKEFEPHHWNQVYCSKECAYEKQKASKRKWYSRNAFKMRDHQRKYYEKNKKRLRVTRKAYYEKNKKSIQLYQKKYREENKENNKLYQREYRLRKKFNRELCGNISDCLNCEKDRCIYEKAE